MWWICSPANNCQEYAKSDFTDTADFVADVLMERCMLLELKAKQSIEKANEEQLINYLKASGIRVELIINFGKSVEIKRKIFTR